MIEKDIISAKKKQEAIMQALQEEYVSSLDDSMGKLYNQFVSFVSTAKLPLPQVFLVLEMLKQDTIKQAFDRYIGEQNG